MTTVKISNIRITPISNETAIAFLMENGAGKQYVYIRSHDEWIGAFEQNTLIAVGGWTQKQRYTEIGEVFVKEQFRRQGIGSLINSRLLAHIGNKQIVAYARPGESKILARHGFTVKQTLINGTHKMVKDNGGTKMRYVVRTVDNDIRREENVKILRQNIPTLEIYTDTEHDGYKSWLNVCDMIDETGAILLEDDVKVCDGFCEKIESIINEKGADKVYNFFEKPKTYFKTSYVGGSQFMWTQCVYLPPHLGHKMREYYDEFKTARPKRWQGAAYDLLTAYVLTKEKAKYWRIRPCLVQHLDFPSLIGNRPRNRQTPYFIDDLVEKGIKYDDLQPTE